MFNIFNKIKQTSDNGIREVLFGDMPLSSWAKESGNKVNLPWNLFIEARNEIELGNKQHGINILHKILEIDSLESRVYLQAWHFLKQLGVYPDVKQAKKVYGVVIEVSLEKGLDLLAAYEDHSARYFNYSGAGVVWEKPDNSLDKSIDNLLIMSQKVVEIIGPWKEERPPIPKKGNVRLNFLTPIGLHFGEGPIEQMSKEPMGRPVFTLATYLMQQLVKKNDELHRR